MAQEIKVMLYGLGAIGSFYAFILQKSKNVRLTVVARSNFEAVQRNGIHITSYSHGQHQFRPAKVVRTPAEAGETYDYIVIANKATNPASVPEQIAPAVDDTRTTIVIAQNGVGNEDPFREAFPKNATLSCVVWVGAGQSEPGIVQHRASENTEIGIFPNKALSAAFEKTKLDEFTNLLSEGKTPFTVSENIQVQRWEKVVWNVAWNSLTTLTMLDTHTWLKSSENSTPMTRQLMREVIDVARKAEVPLEYELIDVLIERILAMDSIGSSMQVDCKAGRPMEVDVILGTPFRKSKQLGVPTPTLDVLYTLLLAVNSRMKA